MSALSCQVVVLSTPGYNSILETDRKGLLAIRVLVGGGGVVAIMVKSIMYKCIIIILLTCHGHVLLLGITPGESLPLFVPPALNRNKRYLNGHA